VEMKLGKESCEKGNWLPKMMYLQNNVSPAQNKTIYSDRCFKTKGDSTSNLAVPNCSSMEIYISTINDNNSCKFNHPKSSTRCWKQS
jgi:hypothetical protein